jgi:hypothetical protein
MNQIEKIKEIYNLLKLLKITIKLKNTQLRSELIEKEIKEINNLMKLLNVMPNFWLSE